MEVLIAILLSIIAGLLYTLLKNFQKLIVIILELEQHLFSDNTYPVFAYKDIEYQKGKLIEQNEIYIKKKEELGKFEDHNDQKIPNKNKSDAYKKTKKEYFFAAAESMHERKVFQTMIEANWLVKCGKKTIEEADLIHLEADAENSREKGNKMYEKWLAEKS